MESSPFFCLFICLFYLMAHVQVQSTDYNTLQPGFWCVLFSKLFLIQAFGTLHCNSLSPAFQIFSLVLYDKSLPLKYHLQQRYPCDSSSKTTEKTTGGRCVLWLVYMIPAEIKCHFKLYKSLWTNIGIHAWYKASQSQDP